MSGRNLVAREVIAPRLEVDAPERLEPREAFVGQLPARDQAGLADTMFVPRAVLRGMLDQELELAQLLLAKALRSFFWNRRTTLAE